MMPVYAQLGGLDIIEELGPAEIRLRTMALAEDLIACADAAGLRPKVAALPEARTGIVMLPNPDPPAAVRRLADAGIVADSRPGHVRLSPYFYNIADDHRAAIERLTS
jgi:kynureninase